MKMRLYVGLLLGILLLLHAEARGRTPRDIDVPGYIADHQCLAHILSALYGVPYPVIMGVAIVESSAGTCDIAVVLNNHFGIVGPNHYRNRYGHKSAYRQYYNDWFSYIDFCIYVSHKKFYKRLRNKRNPSAWIAAMRDMGYSVEPDEWAERIQTTIGRYRLASDPRIAGTRARVHPREDRTPDND